MQLGRVHVWEPQHHIKLGMMAHDCNSATQEVEKEELEIQGQPLLQSEFEASLGNMGSCL